jgi:hypothetical protein
LFVVRLALISLGLKSLLAWEVRSRMFMVE